MEPLEEFFSHYPDFDYDPSASATSEFQRLCKFKGWGRKSSQRKGATSAYKTTLIHQFNASYGTNVNDINSWHAMMMHMGIDPLPDTVSACKKVCLSPFAGESQILISLVDCERPICQPSRLSRRSG